MNHDGSSDHDQRQRRGVFDVDEERALDALALAWGDFYDQIWVHDGEWGAHRTDAGDDDVVTGATPDELNRAIRADWASRGTP
jgi:hypothetical protein